MKRPIVTASAIYFFNQVAWGIWIPFVPIVLARHRYEPSVITQLIAIFPLSLIIMAPVAGRIADRGGMQRSFVALAMLAGVGNLVLAFADRLPLHVLGTALFLFGFMPTVALCDAVAVRVAQDHGTSYGRIRAAGALGFCLAAVGGGLWLDRVGPELVFVVCGASLCGLLAAIGLHGFERGPRVATATAARPLVNAGELLARNRTFFLAVAIYACAHALYDSGYSLQMEMLGASSTVIGISWGLAQGAEIVAFIVSGRIVRRVGDKQLFAIVIAIAVVRWLLLATLTDPVMITPTQALHAITFGLFQVSIVSIAFRLAGEGAIATAQGLVYACFGAGQLFGMYFAGSLLEYGQHVMYSCAAVLTAVAAPILFSRWRHT